jgi:NitT/TauT family transport system substrate-binding protein
MIMYGISAQAALEQRKAAQPLSIRMAVMQGPSGFSSIGLTREDSFIAEGVKVELNVYPSPNEVIARLANGEMDVAALPTNVAANLYNKGVAVKLAAVVGEGMLMLVSTDDTITELGHLAGRKISIPGAGSTPDQMARIITALLGFDPDNDIELDYSIAAPAQLAQMLIAGKTDLAVLPEPFVTVAYNGRPGLRVLINIQDVWSMFTGTGNYPMTVLVVSDAFLKAQPEAFSALMASMKQSVEWVNANPIEAGNLIEKAGIMKAALAAPAIPRSSLVFKTARESHDALQDYFKMLFGFDYMSIGGALPDASFYLDK